ncbi:unnamed protein product, partial [Nesidiocoris tenuis]
MASFGCLLFVIHAICLHTAQSASSGFRRHRPRLRMVDDAKISQADYPFMVAVYVAKDEITNSACSGAIVTLIAVATACHCVAKIDKHSVSVYSTNGSFVIAGATNPLEFSVEKRMATPREFKCHALASEQKSVVNYDAAVVLLKKPWHYGSRIQPILMYSHNKNILMDEFSKMFNAEKVGNFVGVEIMGLFNQGSPGQF